MTDDLASLPHDLALDEVWQQVVGEVEARRAWTWATVSLPSRFVPILLHQFGRHAEHDAVESEGRTRLRVGAPTALDIARNLAGWGGTVEVIEPASVRGERARIGAELAAAYTFTERAR